jgi:subtilisin family serine protease
VAGDTGLVRRLARTPGVLHVDVAPTGLVAEDEGSGQVLAGAVTGRGPVEPGYRGFLDELGLSGAGVTMSVVDDGLDDLHPDLEGRVARRIDYGLAGPADRAEGHGTHVAGILGGRGADVGPFGPLKDAAGLQYGLGIAPGVTFVDQPLIQLTNRSFPPPGGFATVTGDAVQAGASGWNASWTDGGGAGVGYVANAAVFDALTRDADPETEGEQPFTLVWSAGNSGGPAHRITSPKELKNGIVVASSRSHRAGDVDTVSTFSSRGPARDGRIVPTLTAPGETVVSARASTGVLCSVPLSGTRDAPPAGGLTFYSGCSGTSMASPQVAGAVALVQEWSRKRTGADASPAMARALLVNGATDLGQPDVPNALEGWGRVDLRRTFDPSTERVLVDQATVLTGRGDVSELQVEAVDPSKPLRVTLAWTDVPGPVGVDRALVNDLDLEVVDGAGARYAGNDFLDGVTLAGGPADRLNNLENVWLPTAGGRYTVRVLAHDLPADGVRGGTVTDQDFALVVTNGRLVTD